MVHLRLQLEGEQVIAWTGLTGVGMEWIWQWETWRAAGKELTANLQQTFETHSAAWRRTVEERL